MVRHLKCPQMVDLTLIVNNIGTQQLLEQQQAQFCEPQEEPPLWWPDGVHPGRCQSKGNQAILRLRKGRAGRASA